MIDMFMHAGLENPGRLETDGKTGENMARGRMLSKSISTSRKFTDLAREAGKLGEFAQTLYLLLIPHSDDFGRLEGDPFTIKHLVHPASSRSERDFGSALQAMANVKLIKWYAKDGQQCVEIMQFERHQSGLHKRTNCFSRPRRTFRELPGNSP